MRIHPGLAASWQRVWRGLGAQGDGLALRDAIVSAYVQPQRRYHSMQHLDECLALFDRHRAAADRPDEVELALWFHDAVYDPRRSDNEARSAEWASQALCGAGVDADCVSRVQALILTTRHAVLPERDDERILVDVDLAILGAAADRFAECERQIRAEYAHVPGFLFRIKRRAVLRSFLDRAAIYSTPMLHRELEATARRNLALAVGAAGA